MTTSSQSPAYYPLFLRLDGKKCVVVGGGQVALRKIDMLLEFGGSVDVVSPQVCPEVARLHESGRIRLSRRSYQHGDLRQATVAVAATSDSATNQAVVAEAHRRGVLVNVVDEADVSDFIVPSYVHRGDVTIAVSTAGRSPALARKLRTRLECEFGDEYASLALLLSEVRAELKRRGVKVSGEAWQEALDLDRLLELVREGQEAKARAVLLDGLGVRQTG